MKFMHWILFLVCGVSIAAPAKVEKKMVVLGDSLTEGYGVSRDQAYPALLQERLHKNGHSEWTVVNSGISGSTAASAPGRVAWTLKQKPDLLLLALGANDGLRGSSTVEMEENLGKAIQACQKAHVKVLLVGMMVPPNYGVKYAKDFNGVFPKLAKKYDIPLLPFLLVGVAGQAPLNLADGIHPNEKGHAVVADTVFKAVQNFL